MNTDPDAYVEETPFFQRYGAALASPQLRATLLRFQRAWRQDRDGAFADPDVDFEALRAQLKAVKDEVIVNLPLYLDQFISAATAAGAHVYQAQTAEDLNAYVLHLAQRRGVELIVKSKTMVSEETELNRFLAEHGVSAIETDLGEWIVQLSGQRPSHMVMPAIHKTAREVGDLFSRVTGREVSRENIAEQVQVARSELRHAFLRAGMGISGANALVAESGTVMMVTNEGNGELVTSLPPVNVVVAGWEKLVPTFADAATQLRLLSRSATAQPLTSYVTWLTGPTDPGREVHIILLDNGRSAMRDDPRFVDALRCIRCAACANVCPPYAVVGGHVFGYIYSGAIGLVNTPFHHGLAADAGPQSLCISCNACQTVCPVDIPLPRQILDIRSLHTEAEGMPVVQRIGLALWQRPGIVDPALRLAALVQRPFTRAGFLHIPAPLSNIPVVRRTTAWRTLPALARTPFRDRWPALATEKRASGASGARGARVALFTQCLTDRIYPQMAIATVELLRACGAEVTVPRAQHCCGLPALDSGDREAARVMARRTIAALEATQADWVVCPAASCVVALAHDYPHLFDGDPQWQERAERLAARTLDILTFLDTVACLPPGSLAGNPPAETATYHCFCQSANVLKLGDRPQRLLRDLGGVALRDLPEGSVCCGFGGSVSLKRPEMAEHVLRRKLDNVRETGADLLITDNPGCILHLRGGARARGLPLRVQHVAEILAAGIPHP